MKTSQVIIIVIIINLFLIMHSILCQEGERQQHKPFGFIVNMESNRDHDFTTLQISVTFYRTLVWKIVAVVGVFIVQSIIFLVYILVRKVRSQDHQQESKQQQQKQPGQQQTRLIHSRTKYCPSVISPDVQYGDKIGCKIQKWSYRGVI
jgi:Ca2+/Na+ antiporter